MNINDAFHTQSFISYLNQLKCQFAAAQYEKEKSGTAQAV